MATLKLGNATLQMSKNYSATDIKLTGDGFDVSIRIGYAGMNGLEDFFAKLVKLSTTAACKDEAKYRGSYGESYILFKPDGARLVMEILGAESGCVIKYAKTVDRASLKSFADAFKKEFQL